MSKEEIEITRENVSEELLSKVHYGKLLKTFTNLGVESAWKAGGKKKDMIKDALNKLKLIETIDPELTKEEIDAKVEQLEVIEAEEVKAQEQKKEAVEQLKKTDFETSVRNKYKDYSKEELESKISYLSRLASSSIPAHKTHYIKTVEVLEKMLKDK